VKICLISDTHYGTTTAITLTKLFRTIEKLDFDVLVHAGDWSSGPATAAIEKTLKMLRQKIPTKPVVATVGNHDCISEDTEILTNTGWKNINNIQESDHVATTSCEGYLQWQPILSIVRRDFDPSKEDMYVVDGRVSMAVTSKHRMYVYNRYNKKTCVKKAEDCSDDFSVFSSVKSNTSVDLTLDEIRLAAWFCTDSHIGKYQNVTLYQRKSNANTIRELLTRLGITFRECERIRNIAHIQTKLLKATEPCIEFYLNADTSRFWLHKLSVVSNKQLPLWYRELSDSQWDVFLDTLIDADGSIKKTGKARMFYGKKRICEEVQIGAVLHGWRASLTCYRENQWRVNLSPGKTTRVIRFKTFKTKEYTGRVWCVSVENKNFICRRENKVHITGNCWNENPSVDTFNQQLVDIENIFKNHNVHFLDKDGVYQHPEFPLIKIFGVSGWYANYNPPTNDKDWLPLGLDGDTNKFLLKRSHDILAKQVEELEALNSPEFTHIFVSHFPVIKTPNDRRFEVFSWSESVAGFLKEFLGVKHFLNGHAHQLHTGPLRYESGSDYYRPRHIIINI
jgi:predicted phosphodiesterase